MIFVYGLTLKSQGLFAIVVIELYAYVYNMANENVPTPAPIKSDDQILSFAAWVPIGKSNFILDLQKE
nr:hypothetical protein [Tanacetum cinerariifolium]